MYCDKHNRRWDADLVEECPECEAEGGAGESSASYNCPIHGPQDGEDCPEC